MKSEISVIREDLDFLCRKIGSRTYGTEGERKAAEYIAENFKKEGLEVNIQKFPVDKKHFKSFELRKIDKNENKKIDCIPLSLSSFTPEDGLTLEFEYIENIEPETIKRKNLKAKAVLIFEGLGENYKNYENFISSGVSAIILIDNRYPVKWKIAMGMPYFWLKRAGSIPTVSIPYFEAEKLVKDKVKKVFIKITGHSKIEESENVIGFLKGKSKENIVVSAHHDNVLEGVGADDNASGVVAVLELARRFSNAPRKRNLIFISFGSEEVLSYGAFQFVRTYPEIVKNTLITINFDTIASIIGESKIIITGNKTLSKYIKENVGRYNYFKVEEGGSPYSDQFPFNIKGIPSLFVWRVNCATGFYHYHSFKDNLEVIDINLIDKTIKTFYEVIEDISVKDKISFISNISPKQKRNINRYNKGLIENRDD